MKQTSMRAFETIRPRLEGQLALVGETTARLGPSTRREIAAACGLAINVVWSRTTELVKRDAMRVVGARTCKVTGHRAEVLEVI